MSKKTIVILAVMILWGGGIGLRSMRAQKYEEESTVAYEDIGRLEEKLDQILEIIIKEKKDSGKEILARLGQVLSNQERIISELEIVKVRASRR